MLAFVYIVSCIIFYINIAFKWGDRNTIQKNNNNSSSICLVPKLVLSTHVIPDVLHDCVELSRAVALPE